MGLCVGKAAPHPASTARNQPPPSTMGLCLAEAAPRPSSDAPNRPPPSTMALCLAKSAPDPCSIPSWPDLPPDVAGLVLCHLTSYADRLTFGAVCRDWRLAVQRHCALRGTTPWLSIGLGVYQSLDDGEVHRFCCHGSSGGFVLYYHDPPDNTDHGTPRSGGGRCLFLRNPFHASCASIEILWPCREPSKIVLCSSALSIAVILHRGICTIAPFWPADMCRPSVQHPWLPLIGDVVDMAFYRGRIFTVARSGELISHDLYTLDRQDIVKSSMAWDQQPVDNTVCHLVVSADTQKLLMVRWSIPPPRKLTQVDDHHGAMDLHVFEADLSKGKWSEVKELGGQSLVVSRSCCRAFGSTEHRHPRFSQGSYVYILGIDWHQKRTIAGVGPCRCGDCRAHVDGGIPSYCVYDMMTGTLSLVSLGGGYKMDGAMSEWFFPCE